MPKDAKLGSDRDLLVKVARQLGQIGKDAKSETLQAWCVIFLNKCLCDVW